MYIWKGDDGQVEWHDWYIKSTQWHQDLLDGNRWPCHLVALARPWWWMLQIWGTLGIEWWSGVPFYCDIWKRERVERVIKRRKRKIEDVFIYYTTNPHYMHNTPHVKFVCSLLVLFIRIFYSTHAHTLVSTLSIMPHLILTQNIVFLSPQLLLLLGRHMLCPHFSAILLLVFTDKDRIPQFWCNAEVFAASHQRITLTAFRRSR